MLSQIHVSMTYDDNQACAGLWNQSNVIVRGRQNTSTDCESRPNLLAQRSKQLEKKHSFTSTTGTKTYQNHGFTVFHFILFGKNIRSHGTKTHHKWFNGRRSAMEASKDKPARFGTQSWKVTKEKIQSFEVFFLHLFGMFLEHQMILSHDITCVFCVFQKNYLEVDICDFC